MVFVQWVVLLIVLMGLGRIVGLGLGLGKSQSLRLATCGWLGMGLTTVWLYLIHIFLPLESPAAWLPLLVLGLLGWSIGVRSRGSRLKEALSSPKYLISGGLLALIAFYLANQSLAEPLRFDTLLYHLAAIDFYAQYEVIEGLANLHDRLAFQTPVFPLAAIAGTGLWPDEGFRLIVGLFVLLGLVELGGRVLGSLREKRLSWGSGLYLIAFSLFICLDGSTLQPRDFAYSLASPDIDIPAGIILIVAAAYFIDAFETPDPYTLGFAILTGALSATFRPINLVFFIASLACLGVVVFLRDRRVLLSRIVLLSLLASGLMLGAAIAHAILLSGYPFYPAPYLGLDMPWTVPLDEVRATSGEYIRDFARFTLPQIEPQPFFPWFLEWLKWLGSTGALRDMIWLPLAFLLGVAALFAGRARFADESGRTQLTLLLAFVPPLLAAATWFVSAPLPRFGHSALIVLASLPLSLALSRLDLTQVFTVTQGREDRQERSVAPRVWLAPFSLLLILLFAWVPKVDHLSGPVRSGGEGRFGSYLPRDMPLRAYRPDGDWVRWVAVESQQCGRELRCIPRSEPSKAVAFLGDRIEEGFERRSDRER